MGKKKDTQTEEFQKLQDELDNVKELSLQLESQLKRAVADYHNLEKRVAEGRSELTKWGTEELIRNLLPSLDHLEQAIMGAKESGINSAWLDGVVLAVKEMRKTMEGVGLSPVQTDHFDPALHEAIDVVEGKDGNIFKVLQMGYTLNGKLVQAAKVIVEKGYPSSQEEAQNLPSGETQSDINIPSDEEGEKK